MKEKMTGRRKSREAALCALYSLEMNPGDAKRRVREVMPLLRKPETIAFAEELVAGVFAARGFLDEITGRFALNWKLDRLALIERNLLRLALYEMCYLYPAVPRKVAINEAVDLARKYGSEDAYRLVNGLLDRVREELDAGRLSVPRKDP